MSHWRVMSHHMARGESGRIVLEVEPSFKAELYNALEKDGYTLKAWFLEQASFYLGERDQLQMFPVSFVAEAPAKYRTGKIEKE